MDERDMAKTLGWLRVGLGSALFLAPRTFSRLWLGDRHLDPSAHLAMRSLGARDLVLGAGLLIAMERGTPVRGWVEAGAAVDIADVLTSLREWDEFPHWRILATLASAGAAAAVGIRIAPAVD
ncbi:MAG: hypothetical protein ABR505_03370 [Actinomycetota bacterium]